MKETNLNIKERIEILIRARYPLINIVSSEEKRVEDTLKLTAKSRSKRFFIWSVTKGLEADDGSCASDLREPLKVLDYISECDLNGLFLLKDFHPYLNDPVVIRKLRDISRELKSSMKNVILLSPVLKIPMDVEKDVTIIDFDLPDKKTLENIVDEISGTLPGKKDLWSTLVSKEKVVEAALGLTAEEAENVFAKSLVQTGTFDIPVILSEKEQIIRKSGVLEYYRAHEDMNEVGGLENLKLWLNKRSKAFSQEARTFGLPEPKGILMIGVPGCGKSLTAKAVSSMWQLPLLRLDVGKVFSSLVGSSEENVRKAIQTAESVAPSILWLDELEKGFSGMSSSGMTDGGTTARVFGTFLTWLQDKTSPVFVVATSNNISQLPPELLRKGRFDEIFFIDLPNKEERKEIFRIHLNKRNRDPQSFNLDELSRLCRGYSGSEIEEVVISALYDAFDKGTDIDQTILNEAALSMIPLSQTMSDEIKSIRSWADLKARKASEVSFMEEEESSRKIEMV
jgi:ATP-dependent 26S proteasome regulatory subunit